MWLAGWQAGAAITVRAARGQGGRGLGATREAEGWEQRRPVRGVGVGVSEAEPPGSW